MANDEKGQEIKEYLDTLTLRTNQQTALFILLEAQIMVILSVLKDRGILRGCDLEQIGDTELLICAMKQVEKNMLQ